MKSGNDVPSPQDTEIVRLTDEGISEYIEFPPDTIFLESMAQNSAFAKGIAYVPAQRQITPDLVETHLYEIRGDSREAHHVLGPICTKDGPAVTIFGSALSSDGILYLCVFNRNAIIAFDMNKTNQYQPGQEALGFLEIEDVPAPNDVCIDPNDENILFVAGGTFRRLWCKLDFANAAFGKVYRICLNKDKESGSFSLYCRGFTSLAGIEMVDDKIWIAQLYGMVTVDRTTRWKTQVWKGNDGTGQVWLADNIDVYNKDWILSPAYSTASESAVDYVLAQKHCLGVGVFFAQLATACVKGEGIKAALEDPEVLLSFSNTYIKEGVPPAPIKLVFMKKDCSAVHHFEIDLVQARAEHEPREILDPKTSDVLGKRHFFNDQVTHAAPLQTPNGKTQYIACISFEQPRILLLHEAPFLNALK